MDNFTVAVLITIRPSFPQLLSPSFPQSFERESKFFALSHETHNEYAGKRESTVCGKEQVIRFDTVKELLDKNSV